jgi:hypothetical protein
METFLQVAYKESRLHCAGNMSCKPKQGITKLSAPGPDPVHVHGPDRAPQASLVSNKDE